MVPSCRLSSMSFTLYSAAELRKLSVKEVTNPQTFDILMHPTPGGLHDPTFGESYSTLGGLNDPAFGESYPTPGP